MQSWNNIRFTVVVRIKTVSYLPVHFFNVILELHSLTCLICTKISTRPISSKGLVFFQESFLWFFFSLAPSFIIRCTHETHFYNIVIPLFTSMKWSSFYDIINILPCVFNYLFEVVDSVGLWSCFSQCVFRWFSSFCVLSVVRCLLWIGMTQIEFTWLISTVGGSTFYHNLEMNYLIDLQDFGDYQDGYYSVQTTEGEQIAQLIAGYIDIILKKVTDSRFACCSTLSSSIPNQPCQSCLYYTVFSAL